jgi:glycosyltransferase involved in cell wall biosynthesis
MTHSPRPRILMIITELDRGGAEQQFVQLAIGLLHKGWEVRVVCLGPRAELCDQLEEQGIVPRCLGARSVWSTLSVLKQLIENIRSFQPEIIQTYLFHANILGRLAAFRAGRSIVVCGLRVAERQAHWHGWVEWLTASLVTRWVCVSEGVRQHAAKNWKLDQTRLVVIPNGIDIDRWKNAIPFTRADLDLPADAIMLFSAGRLDVQKGMDILLKAFGKVAPEWPSLHLVIAGEGPLRRELELHKGTQGPASGRVHFLGQRNDIPRLMATCDLFVLASRWEGMPNALLEAMATGKPCVATNAEGSSELLGYGQRGEHSQRGWLVPVDDSLALAAAIDEALSSESRCTDLANSAQAYIEKQLTTQAMISAYNFLYGQLLEVSPPALSTSIN